MFFKVVHESGRSCIRAVARHAVRMTNACIESNGLVRSVRGDGPSIAVGKCEWHE